MSYQGNQGERGVKDFGYYRAKLQERYLAEIKTLSFIRALAVYAQVVVNKGDKRLSNRDYEPIAQVYEPKIYLKHKPIIIHRLRRLMELPEAKQAANIAILDLLLKHDLPQDKPFELLKETINIAKEKKDAKTLLATVDKLLDLHNLNPVKQHINYTETYNYKSKIDLSELEKQNKEVKADYEREKQEQGEEI